MRALWLVRSNLEQQRGGDTTQILRTRAALERLGVAVELATRPPRSATGFDLVHLWHLDRLWEHLPACRWIRRQDTLAVLSTIYWPADEFDRAARRGWQGRLARLVGSERYQAARLLQRWGLAAARGDLATPDWRLLSFRRAARRLLGTVAVILPNSRAEQEVIEQRFGVRRPAVIVPNAVDTEMFSPPADDVVRGGVICVGRIEPRKNQLALIEALRGTDIPLTLVGAAGRYSGGYAADCRAAAGANVLFVPEESPAALCERYRRAAVHACVSWYETPGLASLEAGACGCPLVLTPGGSTREYFGDDAEYAAPGDGGSILAAVQRQLEQPRAATPLAARIRSEFNWTRAAEATLRGYEGALAGSGGDGSA